MAGIGFKLRKFLNRDTYLGLAQAYTIAGILGAGPWLLSTFGLLAVGLLGLRVLSTKGVVVEFLVSVTYLMAASMILAGMLQFLFTRYLSDRLYVKDRSGLLPCLGGALVITTLSSGIGGAVILFTLFEGTVLYRLLMCASFVVLSDMWIVVVFVSGMRIYRWILLAFFLGYATTVVVSYALLVQGLEGMLTGFLLGHALLFFFLLVLILRQYPADRLVSYEFLRRDRAFYSLALTGILYNLGLWADRFVFWFNPMTSEPVVVPLRFSILYDYPMFLASLSIIPGMAVFLLRVETDFAEACAGFYRGILDGETLGHLEELKDTMILAGRRALYEIIKVQGTVAAALFFLGPQLLAFTGVSPHSVHLFRVAVIGFALFLISLSILNMFFYLDKRIFAIILCGFYLLTNVIFTYITHLLGPSYYGYGFSVAAALTVMLGLTVLTRKFRRLEYETFMLQ